MKIPGLFIFALILLCNLMQSCNNKQTTSPKENNSQNLQGKQTIPSPFKLDPSLDDNYYTATDNILIKIISDTLTIDSTILSINGKRVDVFSGLSYNLSLINSEMGRKRAVLTSYRSGERLGVLSFAYTVKPPYPPKVYSYKVVKEYPHRRDAYTQGLFFHNGYLYEGTGQYGHSTLCKIDLQTGNVIHEIYLGNNYFGEGICLLNNYIYQLTWQEQVGFIYNADNFEKIGDFSYPTEGWGITTDGTYLIMSDGTNSLYFIDPANMATAKRIEVYSNSESVIMLNELEYINGEIWANVYGKDFIVIVDAKTGAVKGRIDLKNILKQEYYSRDTDVLNGIAYDIVNNRIFITGKNWPKLFEIEIVE